MNHHTKDNRASNSNHTSKMSKYALEHKEKNIYATKNKSNVSIQNKDLEISNETDIQGPNNKINYGVTDEIIEPKTKQKFDQLAEYTKMFNFRTSSSITIRADVIEYAINVIDRKTTIFSLAKYVPFGIADKIEQGIIEYAMIHVSGERPDSIDFLDRVYRTKTHDICANLDMSNERINNKTLTPALLDGGIDAHFVAFMSPQQLHPAKWGKELEKRRIVEEASNNQRVTDIYKCSRCGDRKSTTAQMQTRSADEPMTIFVTCLTCYKTFTTQ